MRAILKSPRRLIAFLILAFVAALQFYQFTQQSDTSAPRFWGKLETAPINIDSIERKTTFSHGKGHTVYTVHYDFTYNGSKISGISSLTSPGLNDLDTKKLQAEFPAGNPIINRLTGGSHTEAGYRYAWGPLLGGLVALGAMLVLAIREKT
jgi:hypothetical protein